MQLVMGTLREGLTSQASVQRLPSSDQGDGGVSLGVRAPLVRAEFRPAVPLLLLAPPPPPLPPCAGVLALLVVVDLLGLVDQHAVVLEYVHLAHGAGALLQQPLEGQRHWDVL